MPPSDADLARLFKPTTCRLIRLIETNLFVFAKEIETPEQARAVREVFQHALGILNARFELRSNASNKLSASRK